MTLTMKKYRRSFAQYGNFLQGLPDRLGRCGASGRRWLRMWLGACAGAPIVDGGRGHPRHTTADTG